MTDEPFSVPNRPMAPLREPRPGKPWWTLTKGPSRLSCELFDNGVNGAGYRLLAQSAVTGRKALGSVSCFMIGIGYS